MESVLQKKQSIGMQVVTWVLLIMVLCWVGYQLFGNLGEGAIADYDEARHGVNAYEMIRSNDYIVHTYQGEADYWNLKPPLSFWSIALGYRIFGFNALGLRFYSAFSMLVAVALLALFIRRKCGPWAAVLLVLMFVGNLGIYRNHFARFGDADAQFQLFFTLAMLCMLLSTKKFGWLYGSAVCFSLAFLVKGVHAINIPIVCFFYMLLTGRIKELTLKRLLLLLLSGLSLIIAWGVARYMNDGTVFFEEMFATDISGRLSSAAASDDLDVPIVLYYLEGLFRNPAMVVCLALCVLCAVLLIIKKAHIEKSALHAAIGCMLWFVLPIAVFSLSGARYKWYVYSGLSALPALACVLLSATVKALDGGWRTGLKVAAVLCAACLVFWGVQITNNIASTTFDHSKQAFMRGSLDRDIDTEVHAYIEYDGAGIASIAKQKGWMQADMLTALLYGDVVCLNGGEEAFREDDDYAILFLPAQGHTDVITSLSAEYPMKRESYYWVCFEN